MIRAIRAPRPVAKAKVAVSEANLRRAAARLIASPLVSTEIFYIQRNLGAFATQDDLEASVVSTRKLPWSSIVSHD